jgi:cysteine sulfinate desulfinase/cysteine desulfurase-like protein
VTRCSLLSARALKQYTADRALRLSVKRDEVAAEIADLLKSIQEKAKQLGIERLPGCGGALKLQATTRLTR